MGIQLDGIYRKIKVRQRPMWNDEGSYPPGLENWSHRRWAWEFLRRNPDYQEACRSVDREPAWLESYQAGNAGRGRGSQGMLAARQRNAELAGRFGRCELKWFGEEYRDEEDKQRLWLAETVTQIKGSRPSGSEIRMELENGQVAMIFDLNRCLESGQAAKSSMLAHARKILDQELDTYVGKPSTESRAKTNRYRRNKLFLWLRLYDAVEYAKVERSEVAEVLYRHLLDVPAVDRQQGKTDASKRLSADLKRAKEMVEYDYRGLVPLDSIQKRSSMHRTQRVR
ncbi:hypothetical protein IQ288_04790 [Burkholderia sp. R-69980]|nr:hypothetical protein [Burkholderia sp. R-69980]